MPSWVIKQEIDLQRYQVDRDAPVSKALLIEGDVYAHTWQVTVKNGGADYDISDCVVTGDFILNDDRTVTVLGTAAGNVASVVFAQECYAVSGPMTAILRVARGESLTTISKLRFIVQGGNSVVVIDSGKVVPNIDQVIAEYQNMQAAEASAIAAAAQGNGAARALFPYNAYDALAGLARTDASFSDGVSFTWDAEGSCHVSGTATSARVNNMWSNQSALPPGMEAGKTYTATCPSTANPTSVYVSAQFYVGGAWGSWNYFTVNGTTTITVPGTATGARIRLAISAGTTVDETLTPKLTFGLSHDELNARIDGVNTRLDSECFLDKGAVGSADDTIDLDTLTAPGFYRLVSSRTYLHLPFTVTLTAVLEVLTGTSIITQRASNPATGVVYMRQSLGGSLVGRDWQRISTNLSADTKYVAFGDSLTYGAVWNDENNKALAPHRVKTEWQIPSRIAAAMGFGGNYYNAAVGGAGYVYSTSGTPTIGESIKAYTGYDTDNVSLVTVMGGANDKLRPEVPLGDATSAADDGSICGAIRGVIAWFKENHPKIQLIFIQPTPSGLSESIDPWTGRGGGGWSLNDFDDQVSRICREEHVGYANWRGCTFCDNWASYCKGYAYNLDTVNYTHPVVDLDYCRIGDYIAGKIAAMGQDEPDTDVDVKTYTLNDLRVNTYIHLGRDYYYFDTQTRFITGDGTAAEHSCLFISVRAGDVIRLRTLAGTGSCKPYALIGSDYLIYETYTAGNTFDGTIEVTKNGFLAINVRNTYKSFLCSVTSDMWRAVRDAGQVLAPLPDVDKQHFDAYDETDVCRVLKTGSSLMGMIHHWAIIGASFDTGEFNYTIEGAPHTSEIDWYEYSCWEHLKRVNGIPDLYIYGNGGQNARDWVRYKQVSERPARTYVYTTGEEEVATTSQGYPYRTGIGPGGGNWSTKLRIDLEAGKRYQAYLINLGSNDINNLYPFEGKTITDGPSYTEGEIADIGTYDKTTDTDTLPAGKSASDTGNIGLNVVNSYAGYMGAILNRIFAYQPDAIVFLATIRNGFANTGARYAVWNRYNDVLKAIAAETAEGGKYAGRKIYILDNGAFGPNYHIEPMRGMMVADHPNALGYQYLAGYWNTLIDHAIQKNYIALTQSMFIGTGKAYS